VSKRKHTLSVKVADTGQMVELMQELGKLNADIVAESRPGVVKIRLYGSKEEVRELRRKILAFTSARREDLEKAQSS
jgi:hypothetical protein